MFDPISNEYGERGGRVIRSRKRNVNTLPRAISPNLDPIRGINWIPGNRAGVEARPSRLTRTSFYSDGRVGQNGTSDFRYRNRLDWSSELNNWTVSYSSASVERERERSRFVRDSVLDYLVYWTTTDCGSPRDSIRVCVFRFVRRVRSFSSRKFGWFSV